MSIHILLIFVKNMAERSFLGQSFFSLHRLNKEKVWERTSGVKTAIKKVHAAIEANDKSAASTALVSAISVIDKAAKRGVYHKNTASRKVSRLAQAVNKMA